MLNKLLLRQIQKSFGSDGQIPVGLDKFLQIISDSYDHYEKDRKMLERSIELTSNEMVGLYDTLRKETEEGSRAVLAKLKESLFLMEDSEADNGIQEADFNKLFSIADKLKEETKKRRAAEQELLKRKNHLLSSQRIAHIGSWELQLDNLDSLNANSLYWSEEAYRIFGFEPGSVEVSNELFFSCVHPDDRHLIQKAVASSLETGQTYDIDHRLMLADGSIKIVREIGEIIKDAETGKMLKMIGAVQDITDRVRAREHLQQANDALKTLFENITEVFFSVDMVSYMLLQISPACEDVYGYSVKEFKANPNLWYELILDEDKPIIEANNARMSSGERIDQEYRVYHKDGTVRWLQTRIKPTLGKDGKLQRIDGITIDTTQRKNAELALMASEHRFRSLIENSADAFMIVNEQSVPVFASDSLYRIMGYTPDEIIGIRTFRYIHPDDLSRLEEHFRFVLEHPGIPVPITYRRIKNNGSFIWCEGIATNLLHDKSIRGIVINFRDITERYNYEQALMATNESLKKTNHELDKFVYSVSHDLRAPLSSMLGVVEFAETETDDQEMLEHLVMLKKSIKKLDGFILDILDYSRNSRMEIEPVKINLREVVTEIVSNLRHMNAGSDDIEIYTNILQLEDFYSDSSRLHIIISNLLSNAIRYSDPKQPQPVIEINMIPTEGGLQMCIKDNGIGIAKDKQEKIFNMFYRVSKTSEGSGIGLYIVKETIEKLGGNIQVVSEPGIGTEFIIYLPNLIDQIQNK